MLINHQLACGGDSCSSQLITLFVSYVLNIRAVLYCSSCTVPWVCGGWQPLSVAGCPSACCLRGPWLWAGWLGQCGSPGLDGGTGCWSVPAGSAAREPAFGNPKKSSKMRMKHVCKTPVVDITHLFSLQSFLSCQPKEKSATESFYWLSNF